jgi:NADPH:quinone reductase-like Zn-dependent oxidoreductase
MALVVGGGYAQYCLAHESHALPVPQTLSPIEAAAIPKTFFTVWYNVFERGRLKAGETLLVHGGSSGIGTTASNSPRLSAPVSSPPPDRRKNARPASNLVPMRH